jgi:hypothetical protein
MDKKHLFSLSLTLIIVMLFSAMGPTVVYADGETPPDPPTSETNDTEEVTGEGEDGDTATFTVALNTQPTAVVTISVNSNNTAEGTVNPSQLTFTNLTWSAIQTVTVTGIDDGNNLDGDVSYTIQMTVDGSTTAAEYIGLDPDDVTVVNRDNDLQPVFLPIILKN